MLHVLIDEEDFVPVKDPKYKFSNYQVSNKGRIKNIKTNKILKGHISKGKRSKGYCLVCLSADPENINGKIMHKSCTRQVHKLVTNSFYGIIPNGLVVNHINGIKSCNELSNLEYCTPAENTRHAVRMGLIKQRYGDNNPQTKYPDKMIDDICKELQNGAYKHDVAKKYGVSDVLVSNLYSKTARKSITSKYDFNKSDYVKKPSQSLKLSEEQVHEICKYLENKDARLRKACKKFNVSEDLMADIIYDRYMPEITSKYKKSHTAYTHQHLTNEQVIYICEMLQSGMNVKKIARKIGVEHTTVSAIRNHKNYTEISKDYDFSKCPLRETIDKELTIKIADMLAEGIKPKIVAAKLHISIDTVRKVKKHRLGKPWINDYIF